MQLYPDLRHRSFHAGSVPVPYHREENRYPEPPAPRAPRVERGFRKRHRARHALYFAGAFNKFLDLFPTQPVCLVLPSRSFPPHFFESHSHRFARTRPVRKIPAESALVAGSLRKPLNFRYRWHSTNSQMITIGPIGKKRAQTCHSAPTPRQKPVHRVRSQHFLLLFQTSPH
jgi:hypothetical protein